MNMGLTVLYVLLWVIPLFMHGVIMIKESQTEGLHINRKIFSLLRILKYISRVRSII